MLPAQNTRAPTQFAQVSIELNLQQAPKDATIGAHDTESTPCMKNYWMVRYHFSKGVGSLSYSLINAYYMKKNTNPFPDGFDFETFFILFYTMLYSKCRDHNRVWDIIQEAIEAYYKAYSNEPRKSSKEVRKLLLTIGHNLLARDWRKAQQHPRVDSIDDDDRFLVLEGSLFDADALIEAEEEELQKARMYATYDMACASLNPEFLITFKLRYEDGLSFEDIASRTDVDSNSARQRYFQARKHFQKYLGDFHDLI